MLIRVRADHLHKWVNGGDLLTHVAHIGTAAGAELLHIFRNTNLVQMFFEELYHHPVVFHAVYRLFEHLYVYRSAGGLGRGVRDAEDLIHEPTEIVEVFVAYLDAQRRRIGNDIHRSAAVCDYHVHARTIERLLP